MDRSKILDKIKKCLALSKSPNEHEAAAALRQAQKLMERHGVTELDLGAVGYGFEKVDTSVQVGKRRKVPTTLAAVVYLVRKAFGVRPVVLTEVRESDLNWSVTYYGPEHRVAMAAYAHVVITRALNESWNKFVRDNPEYRSRPGARAGFYIGWIDGVRAQVEEFGMTPEEEAGTDLVVDRETGGVVKAETSNQRVYNGAVDAGQQQGASFKLHRPMNVTRQQLEKK